MKLMVIDGNSIVNRAFYGVRMLNTRDGRPTNAVFGFLNILFKLLEQEKPDGLCCTFDLRAPTFRHLAYEGYKAQRKGMPDELAVQMPVLKQVLEAMNIPYYQLEGWEADDLIGTVAEKCAAAGWETVAVTGDKDSLQLVSPTTTVSLVTTRMGQTTTKAMTPDTFREEYGFDPIHMIDLKALMGDASDNIPGVKGIGEKTAMDLIQRYGSVEAIYADLSAVEAKPAVLKKLEEGAEMAKLSYDLATIHTDAPIDFRPEDALRRAFNEPVLYQLLLDLEFAKLIDKLGLKAPQGDAPAGEELVEGTCESEFVTERKRMEELLALFRTLDHVTLLALPGLNGVCAQWSEGDNSCAALFLADKLDCYNEFLRGFFAADIQKVTHDAKPLMRQLVEEGLSTEGFRFDTALAAYLLAPTDGSYELERLSVTYFNFETAKAKDYLAEDAFGPLADLAAPLAAWMSHTALVEALYEVLPARLTELGLDRVYYDIELPLCPVLARMEREGVLVDRATLAAFGTELDERIALDEQTIYDLAGEAFNINSPKQLGVILFETLGLPAAKKTKTGYSTSAEVLDKLRGAHPIIDAILEYRQYAKLKSTYVDGLGKVIGEDGRIHTTFQNTVTATGRLSSTEPNLQNIPVRTELGARMRYMFKARPGWVLVDADYSQIELRLLAHMADDGEMQRAFLNGEDIHTATAAGVFGVEPELVTAEMRRHAKAVNFGIVYGISEFSLAQDIGVTRAEAKAYMERYFARFAGVAAYMTDIVQKARNDGFVSTLFGRRRWLPELKSSNFNLRSFGERVALNMPIQGTAADIMKLAMIRVDEALKREGLQGQLILQVHDELIVECPEEEQTAVKALLEREMAGVAKLAVPLTADAGVGKNWGEAKA